MDEDQQLAPNIAESLSQFIRKNLKHPSLVANHPKNKRAEVCRSTYESYMKQNKVSFDLENCLAVSKTKLIRKILDLIELGVEVHIVSNQASIKKSAHLLRILGLAGCRIHQVESIDAKVNKIIELRVTVHFDTCSLIEKQLSDMVTKIASKNLTWSVFPRVVGFTEIK